ncbi:Flagellar biosynthesis protein FlhF [Melioribacter roseus P3M-2]|uniref:Flagellar biosynthesis protein FlhF n=1 Tax=Melioribacter roseus (strain DSM 23840 / JCM 17771 / VKM B-2668 / P3M-2) TaxID=1191523 RepID=I7A2E1_MELRP|nr:flagellar biosynthesis protein FlhF [Melioribacter roseus]AFN75378.1 Flagellar biosynthesis protein FlhF [Melioribacter roseus P3M-2]
MQIKKFVAPTLREAKEQMKNELGGDAIILGTRVIENDRRFNFRKMFEITAGVDEEIKKTPSFDEPVNESVDIDVELSRLTQKIFEAKENKKVAAEDVVTEARKLTMTQLDEYLEKLLDLEINRQLAKELVEQLKNYDGLLGEANLENYLIAGMASMIPTKEFKVKKNRNTKVALVGPTGVGKTTCIAKLAVISKIIHKLKVGLISIDTYRLGAIDQLRIFSEISDIEMSVAYEPSDMPKLIKKFKDKDLIFIDTVGRSQKNRENLNKIKEYLDAAEVDETILVVSATSSMRTLSDVAERFKVLDYGSVIFSKADEAVTYGNIFNLANKFNLPVMFLTNGQVIPDDILSVNPEYLANVIYKGKLY